jgi:heptosyltransferase-2
MRIVVFCPNLIGDTVMATPALRALRKTHADATIHGVIKPHVSPTLDGAPWLDDRILFDPRSRDPEHRAWQVLSRLRAEHYDLAVLLPNSFRSAIVAYFGGARRRLGYARHGREILLTDRLWASRDAYGRFLPTPAVESYAKLVHHVGCSVDSLRLELFTTEHDEAAADRAWHEIGLSRERKTVCLNTGGAFGPAKNWPIAHFAELSRRLANEDDVDVLVVCGPSERESARAIVEAARHPRVVSLAEQPLGIGLTKACVRRAQLMITTDSGPRHFAAAFGVPVVTLFGPTHIAWTRTQHPLAIHLQHRVPCGPCQRPVCPLGHHQCMNELEPESVLRAARRFLRHGQVPTLTVVTDGCVAHETSAH